MATDVFLKRTMRGFEPASAIDHEALQAIPLGKEVRAKVTRSRSGPQHRLFFALLKLVLENQNHYRTIEGLLYAIKVRLGYIDEIALHDGEVLLKPKSIAFDKMDQTEFRTFFDAAVDLICTEIIPGLGSDELRREVEEMMAA